MWRVGILFPCGWQPEWQGPISPLWKGWGNSGGQDILWEPARLGSPCPGVSNEPEEDWG